MIILDILNIHIGSQSLFNLVKVVASIACGSEFHILIVCCSKTCFLLSVLNFHLFIYLDVPLFLRCETGRTEVPSLYYSFLYTFIVFPLFHLLSKINNLNLFKLFIYLWTLFSSEIYFLRWSDQDCTQYSRWGYITNLYKGIIKFLVLRFIQFLMSYLLFWLQLRMEQRFSLSCLQWCRGPFLGLIWVI